MKKVLLFTGAVYGIYMLIKNFNHIGNKNSLVKEGNDTKDGFINRGQKRSRIKAHAQNGNIRGIMKKASTISHTLEQDQN